MAWGQPRLLLVRPDHLGDLILWLPAVKALREALPDARLTALVGPWAEPVLGLVPWVDEVVTFELPYFARRPKTDPTEPYRILLRLARQLRGRKFDAALNFRPDFWWGGLLAAVAGIPERVGFNIRRVTPFLTRAIPFNPDEHQVVANLRLVDEGLGLSLRRPFRPDLYPLVWPVNPAAVAAAEGWVGQNAPGRPRVALVVEAGAPVKAWRREAWVDLGRVLRQEFGATLIVPAGPGRAKAVGPLAAELGVRPAVLPVGVLAEVFRRCDLVVGLDSGPLHLAVAVGARTVGLFGPVSPTRFGPWGPPDRHRLVMTDYPCAPCNRLDYRPGELPVHLCLRLLPLDPVLGAVRACFMI